MDFDLKRFSKYKIATKVEKQQETPEEKFKNRLIEQLHNQIRYVENELYRTSTEKNQRRWYIKDVKQNNYLVTIRYQNKIIPFLPNDADGFIAENLDEVKEIYINLLNELNDNNDFSLFLFEKTKTMKIAKGKQKN